MPVVPMIGLPCYAQKAMKKHRINPNYLLKNTLTMRLALIFFLSFCSLFAMGAEYYVSNNGNDTNTGSISSPYKTIQKAASLMQAGDVCYIREGVYRETVRPSKSGTVGAPLKFVAYQNENVVVTGLDVISDWSVYKDDIYSADVEGTVSQVFVDGYYIDWARYPNKTTNMLDNSDMANLEVKADYTGLVEGNFPTNHFRGAYVVALVGSRWVAVMGKVSSSRDNFFAASNTSKYWSNYNPEVYLGSGKGFMIGNLNLLDAENEWFSDKGKLYVCVKDKKNANDVLVEAQTRLKAFDLRGLSSIEISGIHIKAATIDMHSATNCLVDECSVRYSTPFFEFKQEFNRDTRNPEEWSGCGIIMSGKNNTIKNSYIAHSWGDGVSVWGENNKVDNCIIEDCNWMAVDCALISTTGKGHEITNNTLRQASRSGIVHRYLENGKINNNEISLCGILCTDLGITYTYQTDGKNTEIAYNWLHDNMSKGTSSGVYLDNSDTTFLIHHNVIWNCKEGIRLNLPSVNNQVYNNTLWNVNITMPAWGSSGTLVNVTTWNNLSNKSGFIGTNLQSNLVVDESSFVDVENYNFSLTANSPAINYGRSIAGITDGFNGTAPDAGAYEYGKPFWKPGASISVPDFEDGLPSFVFNLKAEVCDHNNVLLTWKDYSDNEEGFRIERKKEDTEFEFVANVAANVTEYEDESKLDASTSYTYRVCAYNKAGTSTYTNEVIVITKTDGTKARLEAEEFSSMSGINVDGTIVGSCDNNDWLCFKDVALTKEMTLFTARLAVPNQYAGQKVEIRLGSKTGTLLGTLTPKSTGGFANFENQSIKVTPPTGTYDVYIVFKGSQGVGNFDWFLFESENSSSIESLNSGGIHLALSQNRPNPFRQFTNIEVNMDKSYSKAYLNIYSIQGQEISKTKIENVGKNVIEISGEAFSPGTYIYNLSIDGAIVGSNRMIRM